MWTSKKLASSFFYILMGKDRKEIAEKHKVTLKRFNTKINRYMHDMIEYLINTIENNKETEEMMFNMRNDKVNYNKLQHIIVVLLLARDKVD